MKYYYLLMISALIACQAPEKKDEEPQKEWLGQPLDLTTVQPVINTYHMFDSTGTKVGSMVFGTYFENGKMISRDTSSFDNGSVYEDAEFVFDTSSYQLESVSVNMQINTTRLDVDIEAQDKQVNGMYRITRDTTVSDYPVDSLYTYDVFRSELYMLMQTLEYTAGDTLKLKALIPTSMTISDASIYYVGDEQVTTAAGSFDCTVIHLMTDGKMPQNRIWISKEKPVKIVKFYVPGAELSIELMRTRKSQ